VEVVVTIRTEAREVLAVDLLAEMSSVTEIPVCPPGLWAVHNQQEALQVFGPAPAASSLLFQEAAWVLEVMEQALGWIAITEMLDQAEAEVIMEEPEEELTPQVVAEAALPALPAQV
jgi:hypothetical protein